MSLKPITAPAEEPVTLVEAKAQCKVDHSADDALLAIFIQSAREAAEHITGRAFITQTWELVLDAFPAAEIQLSKPKIQSITSVKYLDFQLQRLVEEHTVNTSAIFSSHRKG
jgi:uncharacterized phiE125 gp8 family phage protein